MSPRPFIASVCAALLAGVAWASAPAPALGSTASATVACSYVNLRTGPSTAYGLRARITAGARVTVAATVSGGSWRTLCAGKTLSGTSWHRISEINGRSVSALYGVRYVYGASRLFRTVSSTSSATSARKTFLEGIDVSEWQGSIDWKKVAASGKRFAIIRASAGSLTVDPAYATNRARAKAAGLYVGAYHVANPDGAPNDALREANLFLRVARPAKGEIVPALDLEVWNGLSPAALRTWVATWLRRVTAVLGVRPMIYSSPSFWRAHMGDTATFVKSGYRILWTAHWGADTPSVPAQAWGGANWTFWQYTSNGTVPGIRGRVDLDRYNGTRLESALFIR